MIKTGLRRLLVRRLPAGIASAPFEFMLLAAYTLISGNYLVELIRTGTNDPTLKLVLPFTPLELTAWAAMLFIGALCTVVGLLTISRKPIIGLQAERAGLSLAGCMIAVYTVGVIDLVGFKFNLSIVLTTLELSAFAYKVAVIGQALESTIKPNGDPR